MMKLHGVGGTLQPVPPFDFEHSLDFIGNFSPMHGEQTLAPRTLTKTMALDHAAIVFQITCRGTVEQPCLAYTLYSADKLSAARRAAVVERIRFFLSLDDDLLPFYALAEHDAKLAPVVKRLYGLHQVKFLSPFENAVWAVLTQRAPMRVAHAHKAALIAQYGPRLTVNGREYCAFPEAAELLTADAVDLNAILHNERKTAYLEAVIHAFAQVDREFLYHAPTDRLRAWLLGIRGIGPWSADFILLRGLGRMQEIHFDTNSPGARATAQAIARVYAPGMPPDARTMQQLAARYGDQRGYWAFYLRANA